jgi:hypothetical protein
MRKGGHRYKTEHAISSLEYYESNGTISFVETSSKKTKLENLQVCWLDTDPHSSNELTKPVDKIPQPNSANNTIGLTLICPNDFQQSHAPKQRKGSGLTIGMPYFAAPALLLQQLENFANYPIEIQRQLTIIIVDDGSPSDLQAAKYLKDTSVINRDIFHFQLKVARIETEIDWNIEGSRNLAFYLADTSLGLMMDLDMLVPIETIQAALTWNTSIYNSTQGNFVAVAHKFNRQKPDGNQSIQPALGLLNITEYWNAGGLDEDFAGSYGHGTEPHFWHLWKNGKRIIEKHMDAFLVELDTDPCDSAWLKVPETIQSCQAALSKMPKLLKDRSRNRKLWRKKRANKVSWSNSYLRFNWTIDI